MSYEVDQQELEQWMRGTRQIESSNNYNAQNAGSGAAGAYQFLTKTWRPQGWSKDPEAAARPYIGSDGVAYYNALEAPPHIQDERAREYAQNYYRQFGDWALVSVAWHAGPAKAAEFAAGNIDTELSDGIMSTVDYAQAVMKAGFGDSPPPSGLLAGGAANSNVRAFLESMQGLSAYGPDGTGGTELRGFAPPQFIDAAGTQNLTTPSTNLESYRDSMFAEGAPTPLDAAGGTAPKRNSGFGGVRPVPFGTTPAQPGTRPKAMMPARTSVLTNYGPGPAGAVPQSSVSGYDQTMDWLNSLPDMTARPQSSVSVYDQTMDRLNNLPDMTVRETATEEGSPVPTGATLMQGGEVLRDGTVSVIRYQIAEGVYIEYSISQPGLLEANGYSPADAVEYYEPEGQLVDYATAGDAIAIQELVNEGFESWSELIEEFMGNYYSAHDPARTDPEVMAIFTEVFVTGIWADPNVDLAAYIESQLRGTEYYQALTAVAAEYNSLTLAEQRARVEQQAAIVAEEFWNLTGNRLSISDEQVVEMATAVASGARTLSAVYQEIRDIALQDPESPLSRSIRTEEINQGVFGNSVENTAQQYRNEASEWGVQLDDATLDQWAEDVLMGTVSDADWQEYVKDVAETLYPWKNRETKTSVAAQPYLSSYRNLMEVSGDLNTNVIRNFLQGSEPGVKPSLQEFEMSLRQLPEWKQTANAKQTYDRVAGSIGRTMGFM
jgi:hypothetical protein